MPLSLLRGLDKLGLRPYSIPAGRVSFGHLRRTGPVSENFGFDREGGPVDRYYIEQFLQANGSSIQGRVLEIGDNEYTLRFGRKGQLKSEVLHVHADNPVATIVGDLSHLPQVADSSFDCIILTQTLHLIYDFHAALNTCYRILKPGGVLLLTVPGITPIDHGEWKDIWYWSFTEASVKRLAREHFPEGHIQVQTRGNVLVATSFLHGLGRKDLHQSELDHVDPYYPIVIEAKITK